VTFVEQRVQRGTGDAVAVGLTALPGDDHDDDDGTVLVLFGDTPLLRAETIAAVVDQHRVSGAAATLLSAIGGADGYGRVIRNKDGAVLRVVEHRDASEDELAIDEWNTGIACFRRSVLGPALRRLTPSNAQAEYYLTDVYGLLASAGYPIEAVILDDTVEASGVNDRLQLALAESELRARINERWLRAGVTMLDPAQTFIDVTVRLGRDVTLYPGTMLQGRTVVGDGCDIGPDSRLVDCMVGNGAVVEHCVARDAEIGEGARVGPYAALRPGASVAPGAITGPFFADGA
jgi:bifunctional UDP-N-acetylglucosamine pyrophosphorylase / glucosamine-1-phosphate N-acetyltransferase